MLGVAYKKNVDDMRESPAVRVMELLEGRGAGSPTTIPTCRSRRPIAARERRGLGVPLTAEAIAGADAVLILTDHTAIDYQAWCARRSW